jgi:hypothetical protein
MIEEMNLRLVNLFSQRMKNIFNVFVPLTNVCYTSSKDSFDNLIFKKLPPSMNIHTLSYSDEKGNEWNAGFVVEKETRRLLYELWIKNGEPIAYELYE